MKNLIHRIKNKMTLKNKSLSSIMTALVVSIVLLASLIALFTFMQLYENSIELSAITSSEQAVVQAKNRIEDYTTDIHEIMGMIRKNIGQEEQVKNDFFNNLMEIRSDIVAITAYDLEGNLLSCWSKDKKLKDKLYRNLPYTKSDQQSGKIYISKPHVESLFIHYYPWVVTISQKMKSQQGQEMMISMDIRFSSIANYVDEIGIGQHGYCFIVDNQGNIVYHPQQQLLYCGLKEENTEEITKLSDGVYTYSNVIYTVQTLKNSTWRIVGVSYVEEMITSKVEHMVHILASLVLIVLLTAFISSMILSRAFSKPVKSLTMAMQAFESNTKDFKFKPVEGSSEINILSDSFAHMVLQIQELMEKVRQEEITLRKTELNALQAQINPHFLYNTLDSIAWMCEEERNQEASEMVRALAKLFRISISKGHELITVERELQHAESYLKIQKYRYGNSFTYEMDVDSCCYQYMCNKIMLQPLIENALYHGLDRVEEGKIIIGVYEKGEEIILKVEDNGVGMTKEECEAILHKEASYKETSYKTGIGIKNVDDRIKIYFGNQYGLSITSELDEGTKVEIRMPKVLEGHL